MTTPEPIHIIDKPILSLDQWLKLKSLILRGLIDEAKEYIDQIVEETEHELQSKST
jgi:hypothetical protein